MVMNVRAYFLGVILIAWTVPAHAQESISPAAITKSPAAGPVSARPSWRDRYTLGPGDILNFSLYSRPELDRTQVFVQPDGCISYLQAQDIRADGLTIDELRSKIEVELSKSYKNPLVSVIPFELHSKKYFILGKVVDKGAFSMDRPTTILEAVAKARGIETGLFEQNTVELADLPRSFLVRGNRRMKVDFEKLFFEGDLTQNIELEPGDYLYFASANTNEVYVLGSVAAPGVQGFSPKMTVISAISQRQGFTKDAYREHVLVVRGSLNQPKVFVINADDILHGKAPDFPLQPKDIIYVSDHPWRLADELLDTAISAFIQSAVTTWTSGSVGPFITSPIIPSADIHD